VPSLGLNAAFTALSGLAGVRNDPHVAFNFFIEIEGLVVGGFSEVTGLQVETEVEEYREGGQNAFVHKLAGPTRYPQNLVLKHGMTLLPTLWLWHQDVVAGKVVRRNGSIYLLDRQRLPVMWWDFADAYPIRWTGPELRADSNSVAFESVELVHRGISNPVLGGFSLSLDLSASVQVF
jgi:phage tail-like protein